MATRRVYMTTRHGGRENSWDPRELRAVVRTAQFFVNGDRF